MENSQWVNVMKNKPAVHFVERLGRTVTRGLRQGYGAAD